VGGVVVGGDGGCSVCECHCWWIRIDQSGRVQNELFSMALAMARASINTVLTLLERDPLANSVTLATRR